MTSLRRSLPLLLLLSFPVLGADPLPSWNEGPSKQHIIAFVQAGTNKPAKSI